LSLFGLLFESYQFHAVRFCVDPIVPKTEGGNFLMGVDYDALDASPTSDFELLQYNDSADPALSEGASIPLRGRDESTLGMRRYCRPGAVPSGGDLKTYDVGNFFIAGLASSSGSSYVGAPVGRLFVEYDVEFFTPQFSLSTFASNFSARLNGAVSVSKTAVFGTTPTQAGTLPVSATGNTLTFKKAGQYLLDWLLTGTTMTATSPTVTGTAAYTALTGSVPTASATNIVQSAIVNVTEAGQTAVFDWSAAAATITDTILRVAPYLYAAA